MRHFLSLLLALTATSCSAIDRAGSPVKPDSTRQSQETMTLQNSPGRNDDSVTLAPAVFVAERDPVAPVLDVRTPAEYAEGHLTEAANVDVNAPDFRERIESLAGQGVIEAGRPVYLYCRSGNRSGKAAQILREMGYSEAYNVGGYEALKAAGADVDE